MTGRTFICCSCPEYGGDAKACGEAQGEHAMKPCGCDCHRAEPIDNQDIEAGELAVRGLHTCAGCGRPNAPADRSCCESCMPRDTDNRGIGWWMRVAEAKQGERDAALAEAARLRAALRSLASYAATAELENQPEWMAGLVEHVNNACKALGGTGQFEWDGESILNVSKVIE